MLVLTPTIARQVVPAEVDLGGSLISGRPWRLDDDLSFRISAPVAAVQAGGVLLALS